MATVTVGVANFKKTIGEGIVLLDVWASWCPPCRAFGPVFEAASEQNPGIVFGKLNTEDEPELAAQLRIRAIPTVLGFKEGNLVFARPGFLPRRALPLTPDHARLGWPTWWRMLWFLALASIVLASSVSIGPGAKIAPHRRWKQSVHTFTWGAGLAAMKENRR